MGNRLYGRAILPHVVIQQQGHKMSSPDDSNNIGQGQHVMPFERETLSKLEGDINELKSEGKITGFKIYRIEKSLDDLKEVLERLTDVYHNQSMIQKDIVSIFKELADLKVQHEDTKDYMHPIQTQLSDHITKVKTGTTIIIAILGVLYGIGAWTVNQTIDYAKDNNAKLMQLELRAGHSDDSIKNIEKELDNKN